MSIESIFSELLIAAFWGPLAVGLILFLIGKAFSSKKQEQTVTFKQVKETVVKLLIETKEPQPVMQPSNTVVYKRENDDDPVPLLILVGIGFLSFFYAKYQTEFIVVISGLSTFLLSFVIFTLVFIANKKIRHNKNWNAYLYTTLCLAFMGYPMMYIALNPLYAPPEVINLSSTVINGGLAGMFKDFGLKGVGFIAFQAFGFLTLALAMLLQVLSLAFYTSVIQMATSAKSPFIFRAITKLTVKFKNPKATVVISIFLYAISFLFISGIGHELCYSVTEN